MMEPLAYTTSINILASVLSRELSDEGLALLAASLTQLGDTLATLAVLRAENPASQ